MRDMWIRIAKNGTMVVLSLLLFGFILSQLAGVFVSSQGKNRIAKIDASLQTEEADKSKEISSQLAWRVPVTMAMMGLALVVGFEFLASFFRQNTVPLATGKDKKAISDNVINDETEEMIQKLLREAERDPTNTPAPIQPPKLEAFKV